jgi:SAM-dependent methyltransferase
MGEIRFDETLAPTYDADSTAMFDPAVLGPTVDLLAELAGGPGSRALELAVGTGRVALPLRERGVDVHGIDISPPMVAELRAKPGGTDLPVTIGDIATTAVPGGPFRLVYLVYNTIMNLTSQDEQVACFANAAAHLAPGGCFVLECVVPRLPARGESAIVFDSTPEHVGFDTFDTATQTSWSHHWWDRGGGRLQIFSAPYRYVWPAEMDLMARLAGLRLRDRYASWNRSPFTSASASAVSIYELPA